MPNDAIQLAARNDELPTEFGGDPLVAATWLYYGESWTQNEVAKAVGVSRASVANYLAEARRRGLVQVSVAPEILAQIEISRRLAQHFGLRSAYVIPSTQDDDASEIHLRRRLGRAAARILPQLLRDDLVLGVAWGRTMLELAKALPESRLPGVTVVQVSGSSLGDAESSPESCTALIAGRLGAKCRNLYAPAIVGSSELRAALLREPSLMRHFELTRACGAVVFGVGDINSKTTWSDTEYMTDDVAADYLQDGAAGIVIGRIIDANGRAIAGSLDGRQIGMDLAALQAVEERICVAGGAPKVGAMRATLSGGYATQLITDAETAHKLIEDS